MSIKWGDIIIVAPSYPYSMVWRGGRASYTQIYTVHLTFEGNLNFHEDQLSLREASGKKEIFNPICIEPINFNITKLKLRDIVQNFTWVENLNLQRKICMKNNSNFILDHKYLYWLQEASYLVWSGMTIKKSCIIFNEQSIQ